MNTLSRGVLFFVFGDSVLGAILKLELLACKKDYPRIVMYTRVEDALILCERLALAYICSRVLW
jgi:hypothetical protein